MSSEYHLLIILHGSYVRNFDVLRFSAVPLNLAVISLGVLAIRRLYFLIRNMLLSNITSAEEQTIY
jgi:hypothetical protein